MSSCQCQGIEQVFDDGSARSELKAYRKRGPRKTTQLLIDAIAESGVDGMSLLDIGGGVGAIQFELLKKGVTAVTGIDAASAYLNAAREEARRQGVEDRVTYQHGNFVEIAPELGPAEIVTLDRVICCFDDMEALVNASAAMARKYYGVVFPVESWLAAVVFFFMDFFLRLAGNPFRTFLHPTKKVEQIIESHDLHRVFYKRNLVWQVMVYAR